MSDNTGDRRLKESEDTARKAENQRLDATTADEKLKHLDDLGVGNDVISPNTRNEIEQKLRDEDQQKAELAAQGSQTRFENSEESQYLQKRVELEKQIENLRDPAIPPEVRRQKQFELQKQIEILKEQYTSGAASTEQTAPQPGEQGQRQPRAFGERAMANRIETGPEKKDKEVYLAERRLRDLNPPSHGGGENKG